MFKAVHIGCGGIADSYLQCFHHSRDVRVTAVCDTNLERAKATAKRFHVEHFFDNASEMLSKEKPDVVFITTPPRTHPALVVEALKAKAHVFVEKPLAISVRECDQIIEQSKQANRMVGVDHDRLFLPTVKKARRIVEDGALGTVTGLEIRWLQEVPRLVNNKEHWAHRLPGGVFGELLPHPIYLTQAFLGEVKPVSVVLQKHSDREWLKADEIRVLLESAKGLAVLTISLNAPRDFEIVDIFGTRANLHLVSDTILVKYGRQGASNSSYALGYMSEGFQMLTSTIETSIRHVLGRHGAHYATAENLRAFIQAIKQQTRPPVTAEDGKAQVATLEEILRLAEVQQA